jgi:hypothetical protein
VLTFHHGDTEYGETLVSKVLLRVSVPPCLCASVVDVQFDR